MKAGFVRSRLKAAWREARFLPRMAHIVRDAAGQRAGFWLGALVLQGLVPVGLVALSKPLVDAMAAAAASGGDSALAGSAALLAAAACGLLLLAELARGVSDWLRADQAQRLEDHLAALIHRKSTQVDLGFYDSPDFHDHLHRAREEARFRPVALLENAGGLIQHAITLVGMAGVLAPYGWWVSALLLMSALPACIVVLRFAILQHELHARTTVDERRSWYYDWIMTTGEAAAELRLFGLGERFRAANAAVRARLRLERAAVAVAQLRAELLAAFVALAVAGGCVAWMGWRAVSGEVTLGAVALFYFSFSQGQRLMRSLLAGVGQVFYNVLFLGNLFEFLDLEPGIREPANPRELEARPSAALEFRDVTFRYPGSERTALRNFALSVAAGQVVAIVGTNGAGKSTLLKLLCRFYDPQAGHVEMDGVDLRKLALEDLRRRITVLFQQPMRYNATAEENVAPRGEATRPEVEAAARAAGASDLVARLPDGWQTVLGRWFAGGVDLSVGEWQRIALARAFARRTPLIVLDEPTSAMDSWAEAEWMARFRSLAAGRTTIVITHRFTTAMQADVIHVMDEGRIVESGTHEALLQRGGRYAQSWSSQMRRPASNY